ncbi:hypothetical protein PybrP1_000525 [[Pythium] brassicae (nom. inval.)]|nr:hypothetical protein PybrP1_000525 [[Pythium] brassicae (nom. inval.)]
MQPRAASEGRRSVLTPRERLDDLCLLLTTLKNAWWLERVVPRTFLQAHIACIKKTNAAASALDYRPILLLNSDNKIYARVMANQLQRKIAGIVSATQSGFVLGRTVHATVDHLHAAMLQAQPAPGENASHARLLDFAKAYDSLSLALHGGTTCCSLVNGYESTSVVATRGIQQVCPLASMLFIVAFDAFYTRLPRCGNIRGVQIVAGHSCIELKRCGYAESTALYVADRTSATHVLAELARFSTATGLEGGVHCDECEKCIDALRVQLILVTDKTHTCLKRAEIARAIAILKTKFLARHAWQYPAAVKRIQSAIKYFVWGISDGKQRRAWLSAEQAELRCADGEIGYPDIVGEQLLRLSVSAMTG